MPVTSKVRAQIKRCAVCKIDLKGRFVYIDDEIEKILGHTKEELFGKSFLDFLDESDHEVINEILVQRNHFETFFESTEIHLLNRDRMSIPAGVVVSLNFIAGNPVNFQIVINTHRERLVESGASAENSSETDTFLKELLACGLPVSREEFARLAREYTSAEAVFIYENDNNALKYSAGTPPIENNQQDITPLLERLTRDESEYNFTDGEAVKKAIECEGSAPQEYIARVISPICAIRLTLRFIFNDNIETDKAAAVCTRAELTVRLAEAVLCPQANHSVENLSNDASFTLNFLDSLGIGAIVATPEGMIEQHNTEAVKLFGGQVLTGHYKNLVDRVSRDNTPEIAQTISTFIDLSSEDQQVNFDMVINLPGGHKCLFSIFKVMLLKDRFSTCLMFLPLKMINNKEEGGKNVENKLLSMLLEEIKGYMGTVSGFSDKLTHEYYNQLDSNGNFLLLCLKDGLLKVDYLLDNICMQLEFNEHIDIPRVTDLNLVASQVLQEVQTVYPGVRVDLKMNDMPKIKIWRNKLITIIKNILCNLIKYSDNNAFIITFNARVQNNRCELEIINDGPALQECYRNQFLELFSSLPVRKTSVEHNKEGEPSIIKQMVESLGGEISLEESDKDGTRIKLSLPVIQS